MSVWLLVCECVHPEFRPHQWKTVKQWGRTEQSSSGWTSSLQAQNPLYFLAVWQNCGGSDRNFHLHEGLWKHGRDGVIRNLTQTNCKHTSDNLQLLKPDKSWKRPDEFHQNWSRMARWLLIPASLEWTRWWRWWSSAVLGLQCVSGDETRIPELDYNSVSEFPADVSAVKS